MDDDLQLFFFFVHSMALDAIELVMRTTGRPRNERIDQLFAAAHPSEDLLGFLAEALPSYTNEEINGHYSTTNMNPYSAHHPTLLHEYLFYEPWNRYDTLVKLRDHYHMNLRQLLTIPVEPTRAPILEALCISGTSVEELDLFLPPILPSSLCVNTFMHLSYNDGGVHFVFISLHVFLSCDGYLMCL